MKTSTLTNNALNFLIISFICCLSFNCNSKKQKTEELTKTSTLKIAERPNILWLVAEDLGPYISAFGDSTAYTPNLDRLASNGIIYPNVYSTSGVCSPSRAAIATGMYPSGIGANHMRTTSYTEVTGLPKYEAVPSPEVRMLSELLRSNGYYCTNNAKGDYQFKAPITAWDQNNLYAHWRNREKNQPFFSIFNFNTTHESGLFEPYGFSKTELRHYKSGDTTVKRSSKKMLEEETPIHVSKDANFNIPPYLPDTKTVRRDYWKMYNNIAEMDKQIGAILEQLEDDGLLENTIIFFYGDHGGPMPRQKRLVYDSGLKVPMIIRYPNKWGAGTKDNQLISFVDYVPTLLSLANINPPAYLQGQSFLGKYKVATKRKYIHAAADRFDGFTDAIRAVRDKQFKYIRNYRPNQGYYLPVTYRERIPTMQELLRLQKEGKLNEHQALWFREKKDIEELYDCFNDPHELNNLASDSTYFDKIDELRSEMDRWLTTISDKPNLPEKELITQLWNGAKKQPITTNPTINVLENKLHINSDTHGASIGYKVIDSIGNIPSEWSIYKNPVAVLNKSKVLIQAHRIGFKPSKTIEYTSPN